MKMMMMLLYDSDDDCSSDDHDSDGDDCYNDHFMMMMSMIAVPYPCIDSPSDLFRFVGAEYNSTLHNNLRTTAIYLFGGQSG
jgi:hypothetical protein